MIISYFSLQLTRTNKTLLNSFIGLLFGSFLIPNLNHTLYESWKAGRVPSRGYHHGFRRGNQKNGVERIKPTERQKASMISLPKVLRWENYTARRQLAFARDVLRCIEKSEGRRKVYLISTYDVLK